MHARSIVRARRVTGLVATGLVLAACGGHGHTSAEPAGRVIEVSMTDMAFTPGTVAVAAGETVTFHFRNEGAVVHEALLGDDAAQTKHAADMAKMADGHDHDHSGAVSVAPVKTATLTKTFATAGTRVLGCHQPGHWEAGMKATVTVA